MQINAFSQPLADERFHRLFQFRRWESRPLRSQTAHHLRKRFPLGALFALEQFVSVNFNGDRFRRHTQTMHGLCYVVNRKEFVIVAVPANLLLEASP